MIVTGEANLYVGAFSAIPSVFLTGGPMFRGWKRNRLKALVVSAVISEPVSKRKSNPPFIVSDQTDIRTVGLKPVPAPVDGPVTAPLIFIGPRIR